jgi:hypothetical protein
LFRIGQNGGVRWTLSLLVVVPQLVNKYVVVIPATPPLVENLNRQYTGTNIRCWYLRLIRW